MSSVPADAGIQNLDIHSKDNRYWQEVLGIETEVQYRIRAQQVYDIIRDQWPSPNQLTRSLSNYRIMDAQLTPFIRTYYGSKPEQFNPAILKYVAWALFLNKYKHTVNLPRDPVLNGAPLTGKRDQDTKQWGRTDTIAEAVDQQPNASAVVSNLGEQARLDETRQMTLKAQLQKEIDDYSDASELLIKLNNEHTSFSNLVIGYASEEQRTGVKTCTNQVARYLSNRIDGFAEWYDDLVVEQRARNARIEELQRAIAIEDNTTQIEAERVSKRV